MMEVSRLADEVRIAVAAHLHASGLGDGKPVYVTVRFDDDVRTGQPVSKPTILALKRIYTGRNKSLEHDVIHDVLVAVDLDAIAAGPGAFAFNGGRRMGIVVGAHPNAGVTVPFEGVFNLKQIVVAPLK